MPKKLLQQRRGKGKPRFIRPTHKSYGKTSFPRNGSEGIIVDLVHDPVKSSPQMIVKFDEEFNCLAAPLGISVGDAVEIKTVGDLPEGAEICNVELEPRKGPALGRSSGSIIKIVSQDSRGTTIILPSKKMKTINKNCRAIIGRVAGGGRKDKPLMKAGKAHHAYRNKPIIWPRTRGVVKNTVEHPFAGSVTGPKTISRRAPPGAKVGSIAARRTGKKKR